jgi:hypothetical protein
MKYITGTFYLHLIHAQSLSMSRTERQGHGFEYEQQILERFGLNTCEYISPYDAVCGNIHIQIKCIKYGCAIELGDYFRNKRKNVDFILIVGFWKYAKDNIVEEYIFLVKHEVFTANLRYDADTEMVEELKLITNLRQDDDRWQKYCSRNKHRYASFHNKIDIRFKRDHKTQKRIQCAISWNNFNDWFKNTFEKLTIEKFEQILSQNRLTTSIMDNNKSPYVQSVGLSRKTLDQYYTKQHIAQKYVEVVMEVVCPSSDDSIFIEPSAGEGAFSNILRQTDIFTLSYDIDPKKSYMTKHDFLELDTTIFKHDDVKFHCIGNPPFGRNNSLAKQFVRKCCEFASSVSFILPRSFKKSSCYQVFQSLFHKVYEEDCPLNGFEVNHKEHKVPCVFQIWVKKTTPRETEQVMEPNGYIFTEKNKEHDFSIRRVGGTAGKADKVTHDKSIQSHLFIKMDTQVQHITVDEVIEKVNEVKHEFNNTVGPRSISKTEFTIILNNIIPKQ